MKTPEHKLKWLEKQLELYNEQERYFFENFDLICAMMLDRYFQGNQALANDPLVMFLKQYAGDTVRSCEGDARFVFDGDALHVKDCALCAVWCIGLLQAYDRWRESRAEH